MLTELQAKARSFMAFQAMDGWTDEKAMAHADISETELPQVLEEVERLRITPEERAAKLVEGRFAKIEARLAALENRPQTSPPAASSLPKQPKKLNLSDEERQRRSDRAKANFAKRHQQQRTAS